MNPSPRLRIDVWSDCVCPFCYLELPAIHKLAEALHVRQADQVAVMAGLSPAVSDANASRALAFF